MESRRPAKLALVVNSAAVPERYLHFFYRVPARLSIRLAGACDPSMLTRYKVPRSSLGGRGVALVMLTLAPEASALTNQLFRAYNSIKKNNNTCRTVYMICLDVELNYALFHKCHANIKSQMSTNATLCQKTSCRS